MAGAILPSPAPSHHTQSPLEGGLLTTTATSATFTLQDEEFDGNCTFSARGVGVQAENDIGKSGLSPAVYIVGGQCCSSFFSLEC